MSDVAPLKGLTNLTGLNLNGTKVSDVTPLKELKNLSRLNLSNTKVSDVTPLKELTNLTDARSRQHESERRVTSQGAKEPDLVSILIGTE